MAFIAFEGLDGAGKSTLIQSLATHLKQARHNVVLTREPGGSPLGEQIRQLLLKKEGDPPVPRAELLLYEAARAQHVERTLRPAIQEGTWVLCDRYSASSLAFQVGGRSISRDVVDYLNEYATGGLEPHLWVLLDLPTEESLERIHRRSEAGEEKDRMEEEALDFHQRVRSYYLKLAQENPQQWFVLDAYEAPQDLFQKLLEVLQQRGLLGG